MMWKIFCTSGTSRRCNSNCENSVVGRLTRQHLARADNDVELGNEASARQVRANARALESKGSMGQPSFDRSCMVAGVRQDARLPAPTERRVGGFRFASARYRR